MELSCEVIGTAILKLPAEERAKLAELIVSSLQADTGLEAAWFDEFDRRYEDYLQGKIGTVSAEEALASARALLKK